MLVEWMEVRPDGPVWMRAEARLRTSRRGNGYIVFYPDDGRRMPCVVKEWRLGAEVLGLTERGWAPVGRVARGPGGHVALLGPGLSRAEYGRLVFLRDLLGGRHPDLTGFLDGEERRRREEELAELEKLLKEGE